MSVEVITTATDVLSGPLGRLLVDGISAFAAYGVNFIFCDLMYHSFNIQQSMKGSYWFVLGPFLYCFGPGLLWLQAWIKSIVSKDREKIKEKLEAWLKSIDPFDLFSLPASIFANSYLTEDAIQIQRENIEYLRNIRRRQ